ncbi:hypothetical protein ND861_15295 [Leptospira sp. 2 VSF19]|uniref:Lipoprotein n=1 Tax=Leptospira soteropolitanensis TaxID=2950025 RepID=A0AAW5VG51_9LEPT|nr:hypothetical protein [Leptospira soteropolitanensis]MCW7494011.1 hypothetical protein [Leptospira soteropolitanensis]MCW7501723.1 hypothetical protein [Leptospira soteropolitanensis]MCW7523857.1 hypothetical protein [Leptospira soteropolitanensis]MCW7527722.1 hypothetical protein [Leptospira soteropolitanensis]MCW7531693.1 hypothetical protein [Leptospira soteropolitanensis]
MKVVLSIFVFGLFLVSCNEIKLVNRQDILDLLEGDGTQNGYTSSGSSNSSSRSSTDNGNSNNLNYHGMTDSATGTNTYGSTGSTVGNPLGY